MSTLENLLAEQQKINQQISELRKSERSRVIAQIHGLMSEHGVTLQDLAKAPKEAKKAGLSRRPVAAKYADGKGNTWSGRGLKPRWLTQAISEGKSLDAFAI